MTWSDFLKYSKYIAVFYAIAFIFAFIGIWAGGSVDTRMILSGGLFFCTALAANVALGWYHANHKSEMKMAKNIHLAKKSEAVVITSDSKDLAVPEDVALGQAVLEDQMREVAERTYREHRYDR